jgi:large subunit ribosomal protein L21
MFAVIKTGGKQYRVAAEDMITIDRVAGEEGDIVEFNEVLLVGGEQTVLGVPTVAGATVAGEIVKQGRHGTVIAFKKRRRKNSKRKRGHRQEFSLVRITEILTDGKKPNKTARPKAEPKPAAEAGAEEKAAKPKAAAKTKAAAKEKAPAKKPAKAPAKPKK